MPTSTSPQANGWAAPAPVRATAAQAPEAPSSSSLSHERVRKSRPEVPLHPAGRQRGVTSASMMQGSVSGAATAAAAVASVTGGADPIMSA